jgi:hypothetical protein
MQRNQHPTCNPRPTRKHRRLFLAVIIIALALIGHAGASEPTFHLYEDCSVTATHGNPVFVDRFNALPDSIRFERCDRAGLSDRWGN